FGIYDSPPLLPGNTYFIVFHNNSANNLEFYYRKKLDFGGQPIVPALFSSPYNIPLLDNAITESVLTVTTNQRVAEVRVAVRIDHPQVSDLVLHLVSPQ